MTTLTQYFAQLLLDGTDGATVKEQMRYAFVDQERVAKKEQRTISSLHSMMTDVRAEVMSRNIRSSSYDPSPLAALAVSEPDIAAFLSAPVQLQCEIQRHHASKPSWSPAAERELTKLQILPSSMDTFKLSQAECVALKQQQEAAIMAKNENCIVVQDATALLKTVTSMLENAQSNHSFAALVFPLAIVCGRRQTELLNGKSTLSPSPLGSMYVVIDGLLKKHGKAVPYTIPLLVEYATFVKGWNALRQKQLDLLKAGSYSKVAVTELSNKQVQKRYGEVLRKALRKPKPVVRGLPIGIKEHDLRSIYASYVYHCFQADNTFARTIMSVLGHTTLKDSLSYNNVKLERAESLTAAFGSLLV